MKPEERSHLYVMTANNGLFKIGFSRNPELRTKQLDPFGKNGVKVIESFESSREHILKAELKAHSIGHDKRVFGEWFSFEEEEAVRVARYAFEVCSDSPDIEFLRENQLHEPAPDVRKMVSMPEELAKQVDEFRFERRFRSESEAIRELLRLGLTATAPSSGSQSEPVPDATPSNRRRS